MSISSRFGWNSFIIRFIFSVVIVFASYNAEGYSYYDWAAADFSSFTVLKAFIGVVLLIGWIILIRATIGSLGIIRHFACGRLFRSADLADFRCFRTRYR